MIRLKNINLPTHFEIGEVESDTRFQKVKIYIAHTGENLNNSVFSKEVLEKMSPTLAHVPILGVIGKNGNDEDDFRGHGKEITWNGHDIEINFKTNAYGFIGEDHNAHFETTGGKEWLVADGYLWTRFDEVMELFENSNGSKGQSMEIIDTDGYVDNQGRIVFEDGKFAGLCILGDDVPPAMTGSTISTEFGRNEIKETIKTMMAEFAAQKGEMVLAESNKKKNNEEVVEDTEKHEEKSVEKEPTKEEPTKKEPVEKEQVKKEPVEEKPAEKEQAKEEPAKADVGGKPELEPKDEGEEKDSHDAGVESHDDEHAEMSTEEPKSDDDKGEKEDVSNEDAEDSLSGGSKSKKKKDFADDEKDPEDEVNEDDEKEKGKSEFELSLRNKIGAVESAVDAATDYCASVVDVFDTHAIIRSWGEEDKYYDYNYSLNADGSVKLGEYTEVVPTYLTLEEVAKVEAQRQEVAALQARLAELEQYQVDNEKDKKQKELDKSKSLMSKEAYENIQNNFSAMSFEDVQKEIALTLYKSGANFSANKENNKKVAVQAHNFSEDFGYGAANVLFHN